ncbi:hypothetical protein [Nonomuraea sp. NPDC049750]|uniref:hypothetical protein n=1 Tax=Nonomuraea sp. NPDC049750 TaxID=3154738 RepID=UPI0034090277
MVFLARRIAADPVAMIFAVRPTDAAEGFGELPKLAVGGLSDEDAKVLLATRSPFPLDDTRSGTGSSPKHRRRYEGDPELAALVGMLP